MMKFKVDPHTGEEFIPKRSDQRFATQKNRIAYHNEIAKKNRHEKKEVDLALDKNRKVLRDILNSQNEVDVHRELLLFKGFVFSCITHQKKEGDIEINCIYEFGYFKINENEYRIKYA